MYRYYFTLSGYDENDHNWWLDCVRCFNKPINNENTLSSFIQDTKEDNNLKTCFIVNVIELKE